MAVDRSNLNLMTELVLAGIALSAPTAVRAAASLTIAIPASPDGLSALPALIAHEAGLFKHYGLAIKLIEMKSGAAATKAVLKGEIDLAFSPTQFAVQISSNTNVPLKAIWGLDLSDWLLGSMDVSAHDCGALKGALIAIDDKLGPRRTQLNSILLGGCNLKIDKDYKTVAFGEKLVDALASGKVRHGILHIDELKAIEAKSGKRVQTVATLEAVLPGLHHLMLVARPETINSHRTKLSGLIAALRDSARYIADPANTATVARHAKTFHRDTNAVASALKSLNAMTFYPTKTAGLDLTRINKTIQLQQRIGKFTKGRSGIKPGLRAVSANDIVDLSIWNGASAL